MAYMCDYCERTVQYGGTSSHHRGVAGAQWKKRAHRTRKVFKPNLHKWMGLRLCTKCLRKLKGASVDQAKVVVASA